MRKGLIRRSPCLPRCLRPIRAAAADRDNRMSLLLYRRSDDCCPHDVDNRGEVLHSDSNSDRRRTADRLLKSASVIGGRLFCALFEDRRCQHAEQIVTFMSAWLSDLCYLCSSSRPSPLLTAFFLIDFDCLALRKYTQTKPLEVLQRLSRRTARSPGKPVVGMSSHTLVLLRILRSHVRRHDVTNFVYAIERKLSAGHRCTSSQALFSATMFFDNVHVYYLAVIAYLGIFLFGVRFHVPGTGCAFFATDALYLPKERQYKLRAGTTSWTAVISIPMAGTTKLDASKSRETPEN